MSLLLAFSVNNFTEQSVHGSDFFVYILALTELDTLSNNETAKTFPTNDVLTFLAKFRTFVSIGYFRFLSFEFPVSVSCSWGGQSW